MDIQVKNLDHLGIVAGIIDQIGLVEEIDRQIEQHSQETIPNQVKKATSTSTLRWIFHCFQAVHLVHLNHQLQVSNLTDTRLKILQFFVKPCQQYYLIC